MRRIRLICLLTLFICIFAETSVLAAPASYVVKSGDCLWTISNNTGVSVDTIKKLNGLNSNLINIGQVLILSSYSAPVVVQPAPVAAPVPVVVQAPVSSAPTGSAVYTVSSGDSLWSIAQRYSTSVAKIKELNALTSDMLHIGDKLIISGTAVVSTSVSRSGDNITGLRVVEKAAQYLGTPYKYGGSSPSGFDCSGFTQYIFSQFQVYLSRTAASQYGHGIIVNKGDLVPGDLVFFNCSGSGISHVGIYSGNGNFIHSSSPSSGGVIYSSLTNGYYANTYVGAKRVIR